MPNTNIQSLIEQKLDRELVISLKIRNLALNDALLCAYDNDAITKRIETLIDETNKCILGLEASVKHANN